MDIPGYVWKAIYQRRCCYLPAKPAREKLSQGMYSPVYTVNTAPNRKHMYSANGGFGTATTETMPEGFLYSDFVLFYGAGTSRPKGPLDWSMCRVCKTVCWGTQGRQIHKTASPGCLKAMAAAMKFLRVRKQCVVCDGETERTKFLVYLCCPACEEIWKYRENTARALFVAALRLTECPDELLDDEDIDWRQYCV